MQREVAMGVAIVQFQKKQEAKFICSACGADRGCNCNAPAVEKLAEKLEQDRQRARKARAKAKESKKSTTASRDDFRWNEPLDPDETRAERAPIQFKLLEQVKPTILQMNEPTKEALAIWFREIHKHEIVF
jgi:hypothetical protein